jgi:hypothetical protein
VIAGCATYPYTSRGTATMPQRKGHISHIQQSEASFTAAALRPVTLSRGQLAATWPPEASVTNARQAVAASSGRCAAASWPWGPVPREGSGASAGRPSLERPDSSTSVGSQRMLDPFLGGLVLTVEALGVHLQENVHAVASPLCDLSGGDASVEPGGEAGMT